MAHLIKNDAGKIINGKKKLVQEDYGTGDCYSDGEPIVNWKLLSLHADRDGFDIFNIEKNGYYKIEVELPYGTIIIRYGNETGRFSAPKGTKYEELALPYVKETVEYNEYKIIADRAKVMCIVEKGKVAPGFGSNGGAIQYMHPMSMIELMRKNILERCVKEDEKKAREKNKRFEHSIGEVYVTRSSTEISENRFIETEQNAGAFSDCVIDRVLDDRIKTRVSKIIRIYDLLSLLRTVLDSFDIPKVYYSLNGYREDAVCIEYDADKHSWIIYNGERGEKYNIEYFSDIEEVCKEMICRLSKTEIDKDKMQWLFEENKAPK